MTCRLYIDEVGNDDVVSPSERYLSLTGIVTKVLAHENHITPAIEQLKTDLFEHGPQHPVILHRKEILRREPPFECLNDEQINAEWERRLLGLIQDLPYIANTVLIDKHEHVQRYGEWIFNPYHYCMRALVERYVLWLNRHRLTGDVVAEPRFKKEDKALKESFRHIYEHGADHIPPNVMQRCLTSREIKFEPKEANICGLQLVDMIAHPSHQAVKAQCTGDAMTARFGLQVVEILERSRYSRHPQTRVILGWGQKRLP